MAEQSRPRKILGTHDAPYFDELKELISSQSRDTLLTWVIDFVEKTVLPIYETRTEARDDRPRAAITDARRARLYQDFSARYIKPKVMLAHQAAREAEDDPATQAAARTVAFASSCVYELGHTLAVAYYGAAAYAYDKLGVDANPEDLEALAKEYVVMYTQALAAIAETEVEEPSAIDWRI